MRGQEAGQGSGGKGQVEEITFTAEDLALLKEEADTKRGMMLLARTRGKHYSEKRYEFAKEWAEGNHWNTKRTREWARAIVRELEQMRAVAADRAKRTTSESVCAKNS